jgi:hypothetical protein
MHAAVPSGSVRLASLALAFILVLRFGYLGTPASSAMGGDNAVHWLMACHHGAGHAGPPGHSLLVLRASAR